MIGGMEEVMHIIFIQSRLNHKKDHNAIQQIMRLVSGSILINILLFKLKINLFWFPQ